MHAISGDDWWEAMMQTHADDGKRDAENGTFSPPYTASEDPQDEDENAAYVSGFNRRRKELGDAFKWA